MCDLLFASTVFTINCIYFLKNNFRIFFLKNIFPFYFQQKERNHGPIIKPINRLKPIYQKCE